MTQQLVERLAVAVVDREARDHLRDREPGAVALGLQAHEPVADARPAARARPGWGSVAAPPRRSRELAAAARSAPRARRSARRFRSQISRRPVQREQVVDLVDRRRSSGTIAPASPPVAIACGLLAQLVAQPREDAVDHRRRSRRPRRRGSRRRSTCRSARAARARSILGSAAARSVSASSEISTPGKMIAAEVLAVGRDDVVGDRGAEVDDHARRRRRAS